MTTHRWKHVRTTRLQHGLAAGVMTALVVAPVTAAGASSAGPAAGPAPAPAPAPAVAGAGVADIGPTDLVATYGADPGSLGAVPDATGQGCAGRATPGVREIAVPVGGITGEITDVRVSFKVDPRHAWGGDLRVALIAPNGVASQVLLNRAGRTTTLTCGDNSDLRGRYVIADGVRGSWWAAAAAADVNGRVPPGTYAATDAGGATVPVTEAFRALGPTGAANGTWTIRVSDHGVRDAAGLSAASLRIAQVDVPPDTVVRSGPADRARIKPRVARYRFSSPDADVRGFECAIDGAPFAACTSPVEVDLRTPGRHSLAVRAFDAAGADPTPAVRRTIVRNLPCENARATVQARRGWVKRARAALQDLREQGPRSEISTARDLLDRARAARGTAIERRDRVC